jgi:hypothetical protein
MNKDLARTLRAAAEHLEQAARLAQGLPAVDQMSAFALAFDAPRVVLALATVAGTLDPEAGTEEEEEEIDLEELAHLGR